MEETQVAPQEQVEAKRSFFDRWSFFVLFATLFLLPLFFLPSTVYPFQFGKILLVTVGTIVALVLWIAARLKEGKLTLPMTPVFFALGLVLVEFFVSSLLSSSPKLSLIGQGFEVGTFGSLLVMSILFFLTSILFSSKKRAIYGYLAFFLAFTLIALFHLSRFIFGPAFLSMGIFTDTTANLIGKWNDLGLFFSIAALLSFITLDLLSVKILWRAILWIFLIVSLGLLSIIGFSAIWIVGGSFALVFSLYLISIGYKRMAVSLDTEAHTSAIESPRRRIPLASLFVLVVSLGFIFWGQTIGGYLSTKLQIFQIETRPSWSSTLDIEKVSLKEAPLFGVGPNRFLNVWLLNKPTAVNQTIFWNTDFNYGIGLLPTFAVTTGILGLVFWLLFIVLFLLLGARTLLSPHPDALSRYISISSFLTALFLWVFSIIYIPTGVVLAFTFFFSGLFIASAHRDRVITSKTLSFAARPKLGFIVIVGLIILLVASLVVTYTVVTRYKSSVYLAKAVSTFNTTGNIDTTASQLAMAQNSALSDTGYRFLSELALIKMSNLLSGKTDLSQDALRVKFQSLLGDALTNADSAKKYDALNYQNWAALGRVYEAVVPLGIDGAYTNAVGSYNEALKLNPHNPELYLVLARLEVANKNLKKAKEDVNLAIKEKSNYTEAIFFLSQIQVQEGDLQSAIVSAGSAATLAPNDPVVQFQLGLLKYNAKDYKGSAEALTRAVTLNSVYANAKYFLGLSLYQLGNTKGAITQFEGIKQTNPDNSEVTLILSNLRASRAPFSNAKPPVSTAPEKRSTLPIEEPTVTAPVQ